MYDTESTDSKGFAQLSERIAGLERRLSVLEEQVNAGSFSQGFIDIRNKGMSGGETVSVDETTIESNILEYGLSWIGSIVLLFGIGFLMMFIQKQANAYVSSLIGYISVAGVYFLSRYLKESHGHLSFMLNIGTHLLLFYVTLRLFFFTNPPVIPVKEVVVMLLIIAAGFQVYRAVMLKSELIASIAVILLLLTASFCDMTHETLPLLTLSAAASFFLFYKYGWWRQMTAAIILVYLFHILWMLGNPLMGHAVSGISAPQQNLLYLFSYGVIFSLVPLVSQDSGFKTSVYTSSVLINGGFFFMVLLLDVLMFYMKSYSGIFAGIFLACLAWSIFLKFRTGRVFDPAFYAIFSFLALSAAVYGYTGLPGAYLLLSLQSLLVVSWALWFRSQFIVVVNTVLFVGMLLVYLVSGTYPDKVNFTFAITAFLTARLINWQKMRLELKTEIYRNVYLLSLFFTFAFAIYHAVP
jgi:hypothetical protein